ncbi:hypothetical protein Tco_0634876 [Tanacetum coccineum]
MGGIFSLEARDMDTKLLSAPESNNTLARCWFRRNIPAWQVTVTGSRLLPVHISPEGFLSSVLLWLVIIVAVVGVGITAVVVIIVAVVVVVESSSVIKLFLRFRGGNISFNTLRQSPDENYHHFLRIWHHNGTQGWEKEFYQDRASSVKVPVANFNLQSSVQLLQKNTDKVLSNKRMRPIAPSIPLKLIGLAAHVDSLLLQCLGHRCFLGSGGIIEVFAMFERLCFRAAVNCQTTKFPDGSMSHGWCFRCWHPFGKHYS